MKRIFTLLTFVFVLTGTEAQTPSDLKDIDTVSNGPMAPTALINMNGTLYFAGDDGSQFPNSYSKLWKSDGTTTGTVIVKDNVNISNFNMVTANNTLFFQANYTGSGAELWKSDGTTAGTVLVASCSAALSNMTVMNGIVYYIISADSLWRSDGTAAGTYLVKAGFGIYATEMVVMNNELYLNGRNGAAGNAIWKSDGTTAGTTVVTNNSQHITNLTAIGNTLYFANTDGNGSELWKTDGTAGGTVMVMDINAGSASSSPANLTDINGTLYFSAKDATHGTELWKSDGTTAGTMMIKDINPGSGNSSPNYFTNIGNKLFFTAADGYGNELWSSDGTPGGTALVKDINPGLQGSGPYLLTNFNGTLYFTAYSGLSLGSQLWKSDGTLAGTVMAGNVDSTIDRFSLQMNSLTAVNSNLFFTMLNQNVSGSLWALSGSAPSSLAAPSNLAASAARSISRENMLTWQDNSNNETGFKIERSLNSTTGWVVIDSVAANVTAYGDSLGLANGTTYYYRIDAYNAAGSSAYSNTVNVTTLTAITDIIEATSTISICPNPFSGSATIKINSAAAIDNAELRIYDQLGREVSNIAITTSEVIINREGLADGVYFYQLIDRSSKAVMSAGKLVAN